MTFFRFIHVIWQDFQNTKSNRGHIKDHNNEEIGLLIVFSVRPRVTALPTRNCERLDGTSSFPG
jgi:hypothetical protein